MGCNVRLHEELLKDLLRITTKEAPKLSEVLANYFHLFKEQIVAILNDEYQKTDNDYKVLCGCFSIIWRASRHYPIVGDKTFRKLYPLLSKGLQDNRVFVKRLASIATLNILCNIYWERCFCKFSPNEDSLEVEAEIRRLKKNVKSSIFLETFYSLYSRQVDRRALCEMAGIREEVLVEVVSSMLG